MSLTKRQERKIRAEAKRHVTKCMMVEIFIKSVNRAKQDWLPSNPERELYQGWNYLVDKMTKKFPKEAHIIRSVSPEAKKIIQRKYNLKEV